MRTRVLRIQPHLEPWRTLQSEYPAHSDIASRLRFLLNYAVLAPSLYNSQPWRFEIENDTIRLYACTDRAVPVADPEGRELVVSCGAALLLLRVAARFFGLTYHLQLQPDPAQPTLLATFAISGEEPATPAEIDLFTAIQTRHTYRGRFTERAIPPRVVRRMREAAAIEGSRLQAVSELEDRKRLRDAALEAEHSRWRDPRFCREWSEWLRPEETNAGDGLPAVTLGLRKALVPWLPLVMRTLPAGTAPGQSHDASAIDAPLFLCLETPGDSVRDWLLAGQALGRVLLTAASAGLQASFLSHLIQQPEHREQLGQLLHTQHRPQVLLRVGYPAQSAAPTPRRVVDEVAQHHGATRA